MYEFQEDISTLNLKHLAIKISSTNHLHHLEMSKDYSKFLQSKFLEVFLLPIDENSNESCS